MLVVAALDEDYLGLRHMLGRSNWLSEWAPTGAEALTLLDGERIPIVICEHQLSDGGWRDLVIETSLSPDPPLVIVAATESAPPLLEEVRESGGHDVLTRPFENDEVRDVLANALREWYQRILHG